MQKYSVNQSLVSIILSWVQDGDIAIPEIQRPFVWDTTKIRDLMDSFYKGFPVGYIIAWKNPDVRLKDGTISGGKKVLIDGQQRITAMRAAILGENIVDKNYKEIKVKIAFHPIKEEFATSTPAIEKDPSWISDISLLMKREGMLISAVSDYCEKNPGEDRKKIELNVTKLVEIKNKQIGFIELDSNLDIETVTEIFIRINSKGVVLSQADFAMSKIASFGEFGVNLRKLIDYFCHLAKEPKFYKDISENDVDFSKTDYLSKIAWLKSENEDLYDPDYSDVIRVSFIHKFERGKLQDLVSLLSGRNFATRTFEQEIMDNSFKELENGVLDFISETHFKRFLMIIKSAGFINKSLITSQSALNFAYVIYLKLRDIHMPDGLIEKYVRRWLVMSMLTGRYSGSSESAFDLDIRNLTQQGIEKYLKTIEEGELSDAFWNTQLVQELSKSLISNPFINIFFASQVHDNDEGFLSSDITVRDMIDQRGDVHHLFPKAYLMTKYNSKQDYNQISNFVYAQSEINIRVGNKAPNIYFQELLEQCNGGKMKYGNLQSKDTLMLNLKKHCIPESIFDMNIDNYFEFLEQRKKLMAEKIKNYYFSL
ncbi:MAG TPA: DUF262 domain-containing protein [Candidatus Saccharimonadales bacterium]|nr:DUF262 domain-containing protein [Candidatus Saccharimonadales bacterium]